LHYYQFALTLSCEDHLRARDALEQAVAIDPNFSAAWVALSLIYIAEYQFAYNMHEREKDIRELALEAANKAIKTEPENSAAYYALVFAKMASQGVESCIEEAEKAYRINSNNSLLVAMHGTRLATCGNWTRGLELVEEAMELNLSFPDFYYFPFVLNHYRQGQVAEALEIMQKINLPDYFWMHLINAALYSDIGDLEQAENCIKKLVKLQPKTDNYVLEGFSKWYLQDDLISKLKTSLHRVGFNI
jgi:tetratricopeptide (TPR) repeat protein